MSFNCFKNRILFLFDASKTLSRRKGKTLRETKVIKKSKSDQSQQSQLLETAGRRHRGNLVTDCLCSLAGRQVPPAGQKVRAGAVPITLRAWVRVWREGTYFHKAKLLENSLFYCSEKRYYIVPTSQIRLWMPRWFNLWSNNTSYIFELKSTVYTDINSSFGVIVFPVYWISFPPKQV